MLQTISDWEMTRRRLEAFWAREVIDRVMIQVTAPNGAQAAWPDTHGMTCAEQWTNPEYQMAQFDAALAVTHFAGDAFPTYRPTFGPGFFAGILGAPVEFRPGTVWYAPCIDNLATAPMLDFDPGHPLWQQFIRLERAAAERAPGRFILGQSDMVPPTDMLAALLGPEALCMAMAEEPELVEQWLAHLTGCFLTAYRAQEALLPPGNGYTSWLTAWSSGRQYALQNDFSCMISRAMFRRFCLPELEALTTELDHAVYHLDGPGAIQHLDALLELPRLNAIQWTPGDGQPPMSAWLPLLQRVQHGGKGLFLYCAPDEVETLLRELAPEGIILTTWAGSVEEANDLVHHAERWTCRRMAM